MMATAYSTGGVLLQGLIFGAFIIIGIMTSLKRGSAEDRRQIDLQALGARLGFDDFNPNRDKEFAMGWGFLSRLAQGDDRYAFNILRGTYHGQALFVFDYHCQISLGKNREDCDSSGKSHDDYCGTILMFIVKEAFPKVTIDSGGESFFSNMEVVVFGDEDKIRFESAEFSRTYHVRSKEKKFAYDVCNPQMIDYLLANPGLQIEIQGPVISLAFEPQLPVSQIESNLQRLVEIRSRLPEYLFTQNT